MPIEALPQATVRAIGSTSVISDPCSVVKELIDNALDAGATSIFIEISTNTLDVIQVKDNGHGIPTEDHVNVCKHTFTSKIRTADDLRNIGGSSLGFRGEALASIAEMSGGITITTSVASSVTGSCIKYQRDGEFLQSKPTAHPVGTTVRINDFLKYIPVRKQVVLKSATKILTKIKKLLQSYAIAQPLKRFSVKVLKAKNENNNWMYASAPDATLTDAVSKIFGRELAASCVSKSASSEPPCFIGNNPDRDENIKSGEYHVVCFLPKAESDMTKVNNLGQYLSVDGRPLSSSTGIGQEIARVFKSHIRAAATRSEMIKSVIDPFLCLQLRCPQGSYDVNIEPGKDDVIFEERDFVLSLIQDLFDDHFGKIEDSGRKSPVKKKTTTNADINRTFDLLLSRTQPSNISTRVPNTQNHHDEPSVATPAQTQDTLRSPTSPNNTRIPFKSPKSIHGQENSTGHPGSRSTNPWSVSRMNASLRTPTRPSHSHNGPQSVLSCESTPQNLAQSPQSVQDIVSPESPEFPSPPASRFVSTSPVNRRRQPPASDTSSPQVSSASSARKAARQRDKERYGNGALDTWFTRTTQASMGQETSQPPQQPEFGEEASIPTISQLAAERFGGPSKDGELITAVEHDAAPLESASVTSVSPPSAEKHDNTTDDTGYQGSMDSGRGFPVLERWAANLKGLSSETNPETTSELDKALDFEKRKKEAMQAYRARLAGEAIPLSSQDSVTASQSQSPYHNRFLKAKAALVSDRPFAIDETGTTMSLNDPRAYLIRNSNRQTSEGSNNLPRLLTNKLPFERIPEGYDIHDTGLIVSTDKTPTNQVFNSMTSYDSYVRDGTESALTAPESESLSPFWTERLHTIIKQKYKCQDGSQSPELAFDISSVMTDHLKQFT